MAARNKVKPTGGPAKPDQASAVKWTEKKGDVIPEIYRYTPPRVSAAALIKAEMCASLSIDRYHE
jgi:hypothetical protein